MHKAVAKSEGRRGDLRRKPALSGAEGDLRLLDAAIPTKLGAPGLDFQTWEN